MLAKLQRFNVAIGAILFLLIMLLLLVVPEGLGRLAVFVAAAAVFCWCAFGWKPKPPTTLNSALFLFFINFNLPGWWLVGLLLFVVWLWALTRKQSGDYDFGPGLAIVGALIFTGAIALGVVAGYLLA